MVLRSPWSAARVEAGVTRSRSAGADADRHSSAARAVNAAGLWAQAVARSIAGLPAAAIPPCHYAKGHYFTLAGRSPFRRLVYPVAVAGGLGVHVTLDLAGEARFGPDVEWVTASTTPSTRAAQPRVLRRHPALLARAAGRGAASRVHRRPAQAGSAGAPRAGLRHHRARETTACPGWSICSASNRQV